MIILGKDKVDERYNISDDGIITDLQGNVQKTWIIQNRKGFKGVHIYKILMWTRFGWRDSSIWHVHHKDKNSLNDNINNLEFIKSNEHTTLHHANISLSDETKKKISEKMKGRKFTDEWRKKLSDSHKGNKNHLGHPHSDETKRKISETKRKKARI